ncbi:MAG: hypothetical protein AAF708_22350 [Deinococcota bacterium]
MINKLSLRSRASARNATARSTSGLSSAEVLQSEVLQSRVLKSSFAPFDLAARRQSLSPQAVSNPNDQSSQRGPNSRTRSRQSERAIQTQQREAVSISTVLTTLLVVIGTFHALGMIMVETNRWLEARAQVVRLEQDITSLQTDIAGINTKLIYRNNETTLEHLARRQGFMYPDETRVITVFQQN